MCCRYWADESPEIREIVDEMNRLPLVDKWRRTTGITTYDERRENPGGDDICDFAGDPVSEDLKEYV